MLMGRRVVLGAAVPGWLCASSMDALNPREEREERAAALPESCTWSVGLTAAFPEGKRGTVCLGIVWGAWECGAAAAQVLGAGGASSRLVKSPLFPSLKIESSCYTPHCRCWSAPGTCPGGRCPLPRVCWGHLGSARSPSLCPGWAGGTWVPWWVTGAGFAPWRMRIIHLGGLGDPGAGISPRIPSGLGVAVPVLSLLWPPRHPASSSESAPPGPGVAQEAELLQTFAFPSALSAGSAQSRKGGSVFGVLQCLEGTGSEGAPGDSRVPHNFHSPSGAALPSLGQQLGLHLFVA